jgi:hypothetical protein
MSDKNKEEEVYISMDAIPSAMFELRMSNVVSILFPENYISGLIYTSDSSFEGSASFTLIPWCLVALKLHVNERIGSM